MRKLLIALLLVASVADAAPARSAAVRRHFLRLTGHATGWPGHVVDHIIPLCAGGPDAVWNMQWMTIEDAKKKDVLEKQQCALLRANRKRWLKKGDTQMPNPTPPSPGSKPSGSTGPKPSSTPSSPSSPSTPSTGTPSTGTR